jgi:integrase
MVVIISNTGIRPGELRELRWANVDVHRRMLVIEAAMNPRIRYIPFGQKTLQILEARRDREPEAEYVLGKSPQVLLRRISRQLRTVSESIGVSGVTLRVLRHTFFHRLCFSGASPESMRMIGGYSWPFWRSHLSPDRYFEIADREQARVEQQE